MAWRAVLLLAIAPILVGCSTNRNLANHPDYQDFVGARYRLRQDLFVIVWTNTWNNGMDDPQLELPSMVAGYGLEGASRDAVGKTFGTEKIVDFVPAGTEIEVVDIQSSNPFLGPGETVKFFARPETGSTLHTWPKLNANSIQIHPYGRMISPEMLDSKIVERIE